MVAHSYNAWSISVSGNIGLIFANEQDTDCKNKLLNINETDMWSISSTEHLWNVMLTNHGGILALLKSGKLLGLSNDKQTGTEIDIFTWIRNWAAEEIGKRIWKLGCKRRIANNEC